MNVVTTLLSENETGAVYRILLPDAADAKTGKPLALEFTVTPEGALVFDNRQPGARACAGRRISHLLAAEMARIARYRVPGALGGRTERGLAFELRFHNRAYRAGFLRSHAVTAEMGSPDPAAPDYDGNAAVFERPVRGLPPILRAFRRRSKP
jgi:hypothetical protein